MEEQKKIKEETTTETTENWLNKEQEEIQKTSFDGERKPALQLEENKICEITVDFTDPFQRWEDQENKTIKKIIPVTVKGQALVWWLNVKNPIYSKLVAGGLNGQTVFKVLQTGTQKNTKYTLVID